MRAETTIISDTQTDKCAIQRSGSSLDLLRRLSLSHLPTLISAELRTNAHSDSISEEILFGGYATTT